MADAADSKSVALKSVRVQVPPSAHGKIPVKSTFTGIFYAFFQPFYPYFTLYRLFISFSMHSEESVFI